MTFNGKKFPFFTLKFESIFFQAENAEVKKYIHFETQDVRRASSRYKYGIIFANLPYGKRMSGREELNELHLDFGKIFKSFDEWSEYVVTSSMSFEKYFAKRVNKKRKLYNAKLSAHRIVFLVHHQGEKMKALIQRVKGASLSVDDKEISKIGKGLVVFFCINVGDEENKLDYFAKKIVNMRIFEKDGKINLSVLDVGGEILLVSQFTLAANCSRGNRPDFLAAEKPERANFLYEKLSEKVASYGVKVSKGIFGADMQIIQHNDGPFSVILE